MKQIDLETIEPDPLVAARLAAGAPTATIRGKIRAIDDESVSICLDTDGTTYVEYPRSAIAAAFRDEGNPAIVLLVHVGADVRFVTSGQVQQPLAPGPFGELLPGCHCHEPGDNALFAPCPPGFYRDPHNGKCWPLPDGCVAVYGRRGNSLGYLCQFPGDLELSPKS